MIISFTFVTPHARREFLSSHAVAVGIFFLLTRRPITFFLHNMKRRQRARQCTVFECSSIIVGWKSAGEGALEVKIAGLYKYPSVSSTDFHDYMINRLIQMSRKLYCSYT